MFVQVIQGRTSDAAGLRAALDRWEQDLAPGADGWLGSTGGVTADGRSIGVVRFESEDAARRNSQRPEQDAWWAETSKLYDGEVTFLESTEVDVDLQGDPDQAGFVQVMQGRTSDPQRARELMAQDPDMWATFRPDVLGSLAALHEGGAYTMVLYFAPRPRPARASARRYRWSCGRPWSRWTSWPSGSTEFFDLQEPIMRSATST